MEISLIPPYLVVHTQNYYQTTEDLHLYLINFMAAFILFSKALIASSLSLQR